MSLYFNGRRVDKSYLKSFQVQLHVAWLKIMIVKQIQLSDNHYFKHFVTTSI